MSRYNYDSSTWVVWCTECGAQSAEGDFVPAYKAYKTAGHITGLWCKPCRDKVGEEKEASMTD